MLAVRDCWNMLIGVATHLVIQAAVVWLARTQFHTMSHLLSTYTSAHAYTFKHLLLTPPINSAPATQRRPHTQQLLLLLLLLLRYASLETAVSRLHAGFAAFSCIQVNTAQQGRCGVFLRCVSMETTHNEFADIVT